MGARGTGAGGQHRIPELEGDCFPSASPSTAPSLLSGQGSGHGSGQAATLALTAKSWIGSGPALDEHSTINWFA
jgi:hypothetical protein